MGIRYGYVNYIGCIIYQLFHNSFPFSGLTNYELVQNIIQNKMKPIDKVFKI